MAAATDKSKNGKGLTVFLSDNILEPLFGLFFANSYKMGCEV
jgi:hypothetical protein